MRLSIVVPLYNEAENVRLLYAAIIEVLRTISGNAEIVFVDDGSSDDTFSIAADIARTDRSLRIIKFRRNYGQTAALAAGIHVARGDIIITMDGDLQNDPADIPLFIDKLNEGYDVVIGWRHDRQDKLISRKIPSRIANWLIAKVTGLPFRDNGCSLKAFRAIVIKQIPLYNEMHRFIPVVTTMAGSRIAEIKVQHRARRFCSSKYGLSRIYKVLLDLLAVKTVCGFAERPMLWFVLLASPFLLISSAIVGWATVAQFKGVEVALPMAGTGAIFGTLCIYLLFNGSLGELVIRTGRTNVPRYPLLTTKEITPVTIPESDMENAPQFICE